MSILGQLCIVLNPLAYCDTYISLYSKQKAIQSISHVYHTLCQMPDLVYLSENLRHCAIKMVNPSSATNRVILSSSCRKSTQALQVTITGDVTQYTKTRTQHYFTTHVVSVTPNSRERDLHYFRCCLRLEPPVLIFKYRKVPSKRPRTLARQTLGMGVCLVQATFCA